ncbi:hypothetical protein J6590_014119 [Homalodisca vitripennis]|nr:hypothetical protein J6590_014119 [Homalodisca vitripennis]
MRNVTASLSNNEETVTGHRKRPRPSPEEGIIVKDAAGRGGPPRSAHHGFVTANHFLRSVHTSFRTVNAYSRRSVLTRFSSVLDQMERITFIRARRDLVVYWIKWSGSRSYERDAI